jgi:hypothetical protein
VELAEHVVHMVFTVGRAMQRALAISLLDIPCSISRTISSSQFVS